jgi:hypothetical protein
MIRLIIACIISFSLSFVIWFNKETSTVYVDKTPNEWMKNSSEIFTPKEHIRPGDQTFLTFPEWFLVHSPAEEAEYFKTRTSTTFPFWDHVQQLWKSYAIVSDQILDNYDFNTGYHVMILVLAVSTTVEYGAKDVYETMIGRITDTDPSVAMTEEDELNAKVTQDYVDFIRQIPWYEFDFASALKELWMDTPLFGDHIIRKWERRYFLTSDLAVKAGYGWLIKKATKAAYEDPILGTAIVVDQALVTNDKITFLKEVDWNHYVYLIPRYADFNPTINSIVSSQESNVIEIAGNTSATLLTVLLKDKEALPNFQNTKTIFTQEIITRPGERRCALVTKVENLRATLLQLQNSNIEIEHIYDF